MTKAEVDALFEVWARWAISGVGISSGSSVLARLMASIEPAARSGSNMMGLECVGEQVEHAIAMIAVNKRILADVLRAEYCEIAEDGGKELRDQNRKANSLGLSLRTYQRHLKQAKEQVLEQLKQGF